MTTQQIILKNGLRVLLVDTKTFPSLTTLLLVGAGSRYETNENNGISHFFEHMAFKGSKKFPSSMLLSAKIEGLGAVFNAFTSKDHTGYYIKATSSHFSTVIDVLSDMVLHPLLLQEEIDRERGVIIEELNMYEDTPSRKVGDIFEMLLYKGNPLGHDIIGTKKNINSFSRETFLNYIHNLYQPKNAVLVVAGGLSTNGKTVQDYIKIIENGFLDWQAKETNEFIKITEGQIKPEKVLKAKKTEQAHFCLGFRTFSMFDERKYVLSVLSAILGGGMSSRLFSQVRERLGLCYYISTGSEFYADCGNLTTQAGVSTDPEKIKKAIDVILKEHKKIAVGDIKKEEFDRAKELLKGRFLLSLEDSSDIAFFNGRKLLFENQILKPEELIEKIEKVKMHEITDLAKEFFVNEKLNFAIIGPVEKLDIELSI